MIFEPPQKLDGASINKSDSLHTFFFGSHDK